MMDDCSLQTTILSCLDSTTIELPTWLGTFQTLEISPAWHKTAKMGDGDPVRFPQIELLRTNLDYPGMAAGWVMKQGCPDSLMQAIGEIKRATDSFETKVTYGYADNLFGLRMEDLHDWSYENSRCNPMPTVLADATDCSNRSSRLVLIPADAARTAAEIDALLGDEVKTRSDGFQKVLGGLPIDIRTQLCWHAQGYEFRDSGCAEIFQATND